MFRALCNAIANALYNSSTIKNEDERRAAMLSVYRAATPAELEAAFASLPEDVQGEVASCVESE